MEPSDILKDWPSLRSASSETIFASSAWRMTVRSGDAVAVVSRVKALPDDPIVLNGTLDDEPVRLAVADSPAFPDLHLLWSRRGELPEALLLALVEKECGTLFTLIEGLTRRLFALKGLGTGTAGLHPFAVRGEGLSLEFALELPVALVAELGRVENLDPMHEEIRALTRATRAVYGHLPLTEDELSLLKPGDCIVLPEDFSGLSAWETSEMLSADESVRVVAAEETALSFGAFADGDFPPVPELAEVELSRAGRSLFRATKARVGSAAALRIVS